MNNFNKKAGGTGACPSQIILSQLAISTVFDDYGVDSAMSN